MVSLRSAELAMRELDGRVMILDLRASTYFAVGGAGVLLLAALQAGERSEDDLVAVVLAEFRVDADVARADVRTFLERLDAAGLLDP